MEPSVVFAGANQKVAVPIVCFYPVDVMDNLALLQRSAKHFFCYQDVFFFPHAKPVANGYVPSVETLIPPTSERPCLAY